MYVDVWNRTRGKVPHFLENRLKTEGDIGSGSESSSESETRA